MKKHKALKQGGLITGCPEGSTKNFAPAINRYKINHSCANGNLL